MLTYSQSTGRLTGLPSNIVGKGYSGAGAGKNNPAMEAVACIGPIPRGVWKIGDAYHHPVLGRLTMNLTPEPGTNTFGRSEFRIHGDSLEHPGMASEGCIIMPPWIRAAIAALPPEEREITVVQ